MDLTQDCWKKRTQASLPEPAGGHWYLDGKKDADRFFFFFFYLLTRHCPSMVVSQPLALM